jgi:hypothetical protein
MDTTGNHSWKSVYDRLSDEIKVRHYSQKRLKRIVNGSRHFKGLLRTNHLSNYHLLMFKKILNQLSIGCSAINGQSPAPSGTMPSASGQLRYPRDSAITGAQRCSYTTMIYPHTIRGKTIKEAQSPLDLYFAYQQLSML